MLPRCWLHIGTEKTGSTSIQTFFVRNRQELLARGWLYPGAAGPTVHNNLLAYSLDDGRDDDTRRAAGVGTRMSVDDFRAQLLRSLEAEIGGNGASAFVLSNERLATRLRGPEIARLKTLCDRFARETRVVVYLRNQADFLVSRYTNVIWEGGGEEFAFRRGAPIADYAALLDRWSHVFGRQSLVVRRFEPPDFPAGDVVADFTRTIGLDIRGLYIPAPANPSLDAESLAFLRGMNRGLPRPFARYVQPLRGSIVRVLQRRRGGTRFAIPGLLAKRIEDAYRVSNERVSTEYFGARYQPLFSPALLVSDSSVPRRIGAYTALRIGTFLAIGLLHDGINRAVRRLFGRA